MAAPPPLIRPSARTRWHRRLVRPSLAVLHEADQHAQADVAAREGQARQGRVGV